MKPFIVSSHYNEDLSWIVHQTEYNYKIYTKNHNPSDFIPKDKIVYIPNKGNEASSYLWYIINNYDCLHESVAFVHGHYTAWHQNMDILTAIRKYDGSDYMTLNDLSRRNVFHDNCGIEGNAIGNWNWARQGMIEIGMEVPIPTRLEFTQCAQFVVTASRIRCNSLNFYKRCMDWLMRTPFPDAISGRVFEHIWHYIMTHKEIEK